MVIEKMTKDILMKFLPGEQKVFTLPSFERHRVLPLRLTKQRTTRKPTGGSLVLTLVMQWKAPSKGA
jgi:hypothetical protein